MLEDHKYDNLKMGQERLERQIHDLSDRLDHLLGRAFERVHRQLDNNTIVKSKKNDITT